MKYLKGFLDQVCMTLSTGYQPFVLDLHMNILYIFTVLFKTIELVMCN